MNREHLRILKKAALPCISNKNEGFTEKGKLNRLCKFLSDETEIQLYDRTIYYDMYCNHKTEGLLNNNLGHTTDKKLVLITSHADLTKPCNKKPYFDYKDGKYEGTFDNSGTNAVLCILAKENLIPDNLVFAFTANEENGGMQGIECAFYEMKKKGFNLSVICLDMTYDGYKERVMFNYENLTDSAKKEMNDTYSKMNLENKDEKYKEFLIVPYDYSFKSPKELDCVTLDSEAGEDEGGFLCELEEDRKFKINAMSFCMPCKGNMHSEEGVKVNDAVFEGYIYSLGEYVNLLCNDLDRAKICHDKREKIYENNKDFFNKQKIKDKSKKIIKHNSGLINWCSPSVVGNVQLKKPLKHKLAKIAKDVLEMYDLSTIKTVEDYDNFISEFYDTLSYNQEYNDMILSVSEDEMESIDNFFMEYIDNCIGNGINHIEDFEELVEADNKMEQLDSIIDELEQYAGNIIENKKLRGETIDYNSIYADVFNVAMEMGFSDEDMIGSIVNEAIEEGFDFDIDEIPWT